MKFNFRKVVPIVTGALLLGSTVGFAANVAGQATTYPSSFADSVVVIGSASADAAAANLIAADLGKLSTGTSASVSSGWLAKKGGADPENGLNYGESFFTVDSELNDEDLSLLADGVYDESKGNNDNDVDYEQKLNFTSGGNKLVFEKNDEVDDEPTADFLKLTDGVKAYQYRLKFTDEPKYDNSTAANLDDDFELSKISILGSEWTFIDASGTGNHPTKLTLMGGAAQATLSSGESTTLTVGDKTYDVSATVYSDEVRFVINGEAVTVDEGATQKLSDGTNLGVTEISTSSKETTADQATFFLGAKKLVLENGQEVSVNGEELDGSTVTITVDQTNKELKEIAVSWAPEDDTYIAAGQSVEDPVFGKFKFVFTGVDKKTEEIKVTTSANDGKLVVKDTAGNMVEIPFKDNATDVFLGDDLKTSTQTLRQGGALGGGNLLVADEDYCLGTNLLTDCEDIMFLAVSADGEARVIELRDVDLGNQEFDFRDKTTGKDINDVDYTNGTSNSLDIGFMTVSVSVLNATGGTASTMKLLNFTDINKYSDISGAFETSLEGALKVAASGSEQQVTLYQENNSAIATFKMDVESDGDMIVTTLSPTMTDIRKDDPNDIQVGIDLTNWGALFTWDSEDKNDLTITYNEDVVEGKAYVSPTEAAVTGAGAAVPTVKDSELSSATKTSKNLVVVGGPAINSLAAELLGKTYPTYGPDLGWSADSATIQLFEGASALTPGKVALLVAGYEKADTLAAAKHLIANKQLSASLTKATATSYYA